MLTVIGPLPGVYGVAIWQKLLRWLKNGPWEVVRVSDGAPTPLCDLRVVEISDRIAGSYCGKLLVDAGAQVRKIEPPQGDSLRRYSASGSPIPEGADSPFYSYLNAGKRSMAIAGNPQRLSAELAGADVVVITASPSKAAALG